jgi:hypothetical protein
MRIAINLIGYEVPSQNTYNGWHWSKRHRDTMRLERWIRSVHPYPPAEGHRHLHIHRVCRQRITDDANLRGGAKGLVDAIKRAGLIKDDKDQLATITYSQATRGSGKSRTVITVSTEPITEDQYDI